MKKSLPCLLAALGLANPALPSARANDDPPADPKKETKELRVISGPDHRSMLRHFDGGEKESVTYLGIDTAPVPAALTDQLGLPNGTGLIVNRVEPESPAAATLKLHDILLKLDDQILIETRQLLVLIRNHKEGDEVTLTYLRSGKQATAKVKLAKHDVPKMSFDFAPGEGFKLFSNGTGGGADFAFRNISPNVFAGEDADHVLGLINGGPANSGVQHLKIARAAGSGSGERNISVTVNTGNSHMVLDDDKGSIDLTIKDGKKELVAKNAKGEQIFSGPIDTPEERKALPDEVRGRLEKLEDSTQFTYKTDGGFKAETKIAQPRGQGISLPAILLERGVAQPFF